MIEGYSLTWTTVGIRQSGELNASAGTLEAVELFISLDILTERTGTLEAVTGLQNTISDIAGLGNINVRDLSLLKQNNDKEKYRDFFVFVDYGSRTKDQTNSVKHKGGIGGTAVVHEVGDGVHANGDLRVLVIHHRETIVVQTTNTGKNLSQWALLFVIPGLFLYDGIDNLELRNRKEIYISHFFVLFNGFGVGNTYKL